MLLDPLFDERVGAGGVARRIGHRQDRLVRADRESWLRAERGILQALGEPRRVFRPNSIIVLASFDGWLGQQPALLSYATSQRHLASVS
jgi:hypothetical protein